MDDINKPSNNGATSNNDDKQRELQIEELNTETKAKRKRRTKNKKESDYQEKIIFEIKNIKNPQIRKEALAMKQKRDDTVKDYEKVKNAILEAEKQLDKLIRENSQENIKKENIATVAKVGDDYAQYMASRGEKINPEELKKQLFSLSEKPEPDATDQESEEE